MLRFSFRENMVKYCCLLLYSMLKFSTCLESFITINTPQGDINGYRISDNTHGHHISMFLGIPYARPPVGKLRFARPVPRTPWKRAILNATKFGSSCPQPKWFLRKLSFGAQYDDFSENCLTLNVYSPANLSDPTDRYPVMVWIHGGAYKAGSGSQYDGRILCQKGVVVVTINYRLGALGFLSTEDSYAPGNLGLLDQNLALQWVQSNIGPFGGDSSRVTIFGQSAGGGSVSLHLFSPMSSGLFRSAISESGSALSPWAVYRPPLSPKTSATELARNLQCPTSTSPSLVECLRNKSADDIISATIPGPQSIEAFAPRVDGYFLKDLPENIFKKGNFNANVTVLTGFVPNESSDEIPTNFDANNGYTRHHFRQLVATWSKRYRYSKSVDAAILCEYNSSQSDTEVYRSLFMELNSDNRYIYPIIRTAQELTKSGIPTVLYEFDYRSQNEARPRWNGIYHGYELPFLFGAPFFNTSSCPGKQWEACPETWFQSLWTSIDRKLSVDVSEMWTTFAKNYQLRDPRSRYTLKNQNFVYISTNTTIQSKPKDKRVQFWSHFDYLNHDTNPANPCNNQGGAFG